MALTQKIDKTKREKVPFHIQDIDAYYHNWFGHRLGHHLNHIGAIIECHNLLIEDLEEAVHNFESVLKNHFPEFLDSLYNKEIPIQDSCSWSSITFAWTLNAYIDFLSEQEDNKNVVSLNYLVLAIILNSLCLNDLCENKTNSSDFPYKTASTLILTLFIDSVEALRYAASSFDAEQNSKADGNLANIQNHIRNEERKRIASLGGRKKANKSAKAKEEAFRQYDLMKTDKPHTAARKLGPILFESGLYTFANEFAAIKTVGCWLAEYERRKKNSVY